MLHGVDLDPVDEGLNDEAFEGCLIHRHQGECGDLGEAFGLEVLEDLRPGARLEGEVVEGDHLRGRRGECR